MNENESRAISKSILVDIAYGFEPMTRTLAETIKKLRCDQRLTLEKLPGALNSGFENDFALGKDLALKAKQFLGENDPNWD